MRAYLRRRGETTRPMPGIATVYLFMTSSAPIGCDGLCAAHCARRGRASLSSGPPGQVGGLRVLVSLWALRRPMHPRSLPSGAGACRLSLEPAWWGQRRCSERAVINSSTAAHALRMDPLQLFGEDFLAASLDKRCRAAVDAWRRVQQLPHPEGGTGHRCQDMSKIQRHGMPKMYEACRVAD